VEFDFFDSANQNAYVAHVKSQSKKTTPANRPSFQSAHLAALAQLCANLLASHRG
jgi:hypothetical protein